MPLFSKGIGLGIKLGIIGKARNNAPATSVTKKAKPIKTSIKAPTNKTSGTGRKSIIKKKKDVLGG